MYVIVAAAFMSPAGCLLLTLLSPALLQAPLSPSSRGPDCRDTHDCRQLATAAAARKDYEAFHDFAWRTVQTGPKNDPGALFLLARAQSLSGRPGDALVMLRRLAEMNVPNDAAASDDFAGARALPGWAEIEARLAGPAASVPLASGSGRTGPSPAASGVSLTEGSTVASGVSPTVVSAVKSAPSRTTSTESLRFTTPFFAPAGLAYDGVSRRFIVGDRNARKLAVVDEFSHHVASLASGFDEITALEIDAQEGMLWVVTAATRQTTLHKLQLVSGRSLASYVVPESFGPARFVDVASAAGRTTLALDRAGRRLFKLRPKGVALEVAASLPMGPTTLAPAPDGVVYIAHDMGVARVDAPARTATALNGAGGVDLTGIVRLRWHRGSLIAIQSANEGAYRAIRITLDSSRRAATRVTTLGESFRTADPTAATVVGDVLYFLANGEGAETIVRKVVLR